MHTTSFTTSPVDFSGYTTAGQIIDRMTYLEAHRSPWYMDDNWADWEYDILTSMLYG